MKSIVFVATLALAATVAAQDEERLAWSEPWAPTVWTAGKNATLRWTNKCDFDTDGNDQKNGVAVTLYKTVASGLQERVEGLPDLGIIDCVNTHEFNIVVPNVPTFDKYVVHGLTHPYRSFSAEFKIINENDKPTATATNGTGATGATSATASPSTAPSEASKDAAKGGQNAAGVVGVVGSSFAIVAAAAAALFF